MEERDVFGVQFPGTKQIGFVSVMGLLREHLAVSVYLGEESLAIFWEIQDSEVLEEPERIFEMRQLMGSFEDRDRLENEDRDMIRRLGLKFRGKSAWPLFRSYRPGCYPWILDEEEVGWLSCALEQATAVASRLKEDPSVLDTAEPDRVLVRVAKRDGERWKWRNSVRRIERPKPAVLDLKIEASAVRTLSALPRRNHPIDMDFFLGPGCIAEKGARPSLYFVLLAVDGHAGSVLGYEILQAPEGLPAMWEGVSGKAADILSSIGFRPAELRVRSQRLLRLLEPLESVRGIKVRHRDRLPALEEAHQAVLHFFQESR